MKKEKFSYFWLPCTFLPTFFSITMISYYHFTLVVSYWPWLLCAAVLAGLVYQRYFRGLNKFDGPFLSSFTNLWRAWNLCGRKNKMPLSTLHEKYGTIVRIGPNVLSFNDPNAIKDIYNKRFVKVDRNTMFPRCAFLQVIQF